MRGCLRSTDVGPNRLYPNCDLIQITFGIYTNDKKAERYYNQPNIYGGFFAKIVNALKDIANDTDIVTFKGTLMQI